MLDETTQQRIRSAATAARDLFDAWRIAAPSPFTTTVGHVLTAIRDAAQAWEKAGEAVIMMARSHTKESK